MRTLTLIISILTLHTSLAFAQTTSFHSIPSSGFTPQVVSESDGYGGNRTGTARSFDNGLWMFAPVTLPHGATVTAMRCGGKAPDNIHRIVFTLRRNQPQVVNVDMATVMTTYEELGFRHPQTTSITSPVIDNANFNYYIAAMAQPLDVQRCPKCTVGYCRIRYTTGDPTGPSPVIDDHSPVIEKRK